MSHANSPLPEIGRTEQSRPNTFNRFGVWVALVAIVGAAVHGLALLAGPPSLQHDSVWYIQIATDMAARGDFTNKLLLQRPIGYPLFLAGIFLLFGKHSALGLLLIQHLLMLGTGILGMLIARRLSGSIELAVLTGLLLVTNFQLIGYGQSVFSEALYIPLTAAVLYALVTFVRFRSLGWLGLASFVAGLACIVRVTGPLLVMGVLVVAATVFCIEMRRWQAKRLRYGAMYSMTACLPAFAFVIAQIAFNATVFGQFESSGRTGNYLYYATREIYGFESDRSEAMVRINRAFDEYEARHCLGEKTLNRFVGERAIEALTEVEELSDQQADKILRRAAIDLALENPVALVIGTVRHIAYTLLLPDNAHRFLPGGERGDGNYLPVGTVIYDSDVLFQSNARLESDPAVKRFLRFDHDPNAATKLWKPVVVGCYFFWEGSPSLLYINDSRYEDYILLCMLGALVCFWRINRLEAFVLLVVMGLHVLGTSAIIALPRYLAPWRVIMDLWCAIGILELVRWGGFAFTNLKRQILSSKPAAT